ncbi:helix-turn-helix domain-containing protein [Paracoccus sp. (in: a-proteobacteria)]|uniref:helix-turn-helix domain-containing protein n=1 Tax=Paracoccus sp. TaxID=267 RepID=UPI00321FE441
MARCTNLRLGKPRTYVNIPALNWASAVEGLPKGAKALLLFVARYCDKYGVVWYKQSAIGLELGCDPRSVRNYLKVLLQLGLVRRIGQGRGGRQVSNVYHFIAWPGRQLVILPMVKGMRR